MSCVYGIEQSCDECRMCQSKKEEEQANTETAKERKGDLISRERATQEISEIMADALISVFSQNTVSFGELNHKIQECLKNQPVAYDVDKVVEQLNQQAEQYRARANEFALKDMTRQCEYMKGKLYSYEHAIEIAKKGGANE